METNGTEDLGGKLGVDPGKLLGGNDAMQERLDEPQIHPEVNAELRRPPDDVLLGERLAPVVKNPGHAREVGIDSVGDGKTLGRIRHREGVRETAWLLRELPFHVALEATHHGKLVGIEAWQRSTHLVVTLPERASVVALRRTVEPMLVQVTNHGVGCEVAQALTHAHAVAEIARRDGQRGHLEIGDVETEPRGGDGVPCPIEVVSRTRGSDKMGKTGDVDRIPPHDDLADGVGTGDEVELDVAGVDLAQKTERLRGIGDAFSVDLETRCKEVGVIRRRKQRHGIAILTRGDDPVLFERRPSRGHEDHEVETEVVEGLLGSHEVTVVDGVEGTAHDAEPIRGGGVRPQHRKIVLA